MSLLAIDKRNGRTAYKAQFTNNMGLLDISGDAQTKTVDLVMQSDTVRLTFTDKPLPPPSATDGQPAHAAGQRRHPGPLELDRKDPRRPAGRVGAKGGEVAVWHRSVAQVATVSREQHGWALRVRCVPP